MIVMDRMAIEAAVRAYYSGQRLGAVVGGSVSLIIIAGAAVMIWKGDSFLRGLAIILAAMAFIISVLGASLAIRDASTPSRLMADADLAPIKDEAARMGKVVENYRYYRIAFAALAALGVLLIVLRFDAFWDGIAVGLFLLASLGLGIDHFDRQHAGRYLTALRS
jgi:hypothetical protein